MADKETVSDWGIHLWRHFQVLAASFPECFPPVQLAELKCNHFYDGLPKCLKSHGDLPEGQPAGRLIPITCGVQGKQRRKTPWSYPKAHEAKQLITP